MATFVINGTTLNLNSNSMEINIESDGKVYISEGGFWPQPLNLGESLVKGKVLQREPGVSMRELVKSNFPKVGMTKQIQAASDKTIRAGFYALGRTAKVKEISSGVFEVKRMS